MKRLLLIFVINCFSLIASAQYYTFIYIAHDETCHTEEMVNNLREIFDAADEENPCLLYLASDENPLIIRSDISTGDEVESFFSEFFRTDFHRIATGYDLERIVGLVREYGLLDRKYEITTFSFYLTNSFIDVGFFDELVTKLCFCLELENEGRRVGIRIVSSSEDDIDEVKIKDPKGLLSNILVRYQNY